MLTFPKHIPLQLRHRHNQVSFQPTYNQEQERPSLLTFPKLGKVLVKQFFSCEFGEVVIIKRIPCWTFRSIGHILLRGPWRARGSGSCRPGKVSPKGEGKENIKTQKGPSNFLSLRYQFFPQSNHHFPQCFPKGPPTDTEKFSLYIYKRCSFS